MATVELAYNAENKEFMAHAACQKWVTRQFYGKITPRELSWGLFKCPDYLKVRGEASMGVRSTRLFSVELDHLQCYSHLPDVVLDQLLSHWSSSALAEETHRCSGEQRTRGEARR